jgi:hypothetical protein
VTSPQLGTITSVPSGAPYVSQRGPAKDCVIASIATAIVQSYETVAEALHVPIDPDSGRPDLSRHSADGIHSFDTIYPLYKMGWSAALIVTREGAKGSGFGQDAPTSDELKRFLVGKSGTIGYEDSDPTVGAHDLAWTGAIAIDCTTGEEIDLGTITILNAIVLTPLAK